ncbi:universal stress protein [Halomonadaceae bacterium KBTZ08]
MTRGNDAEPLMERIWVLLDSSHQSRVALETAVDLAALLDIELQGLFIEDENLLKMAELPFTREVGATSAATRPLDSQTLERRLKREAQQLEQHLALQAQGRRLRWGFQVRRGSLPEAALSSVSPQDLVTMGKVGWSSSRGEHLGRTARAMLGEAPCSVLFTSETAAFEADHPIVVWYEPPYGAQEALETGVRIARAERRPLKLLWATQETGPEAGERQEVEARALASGVALEVESWPRADASALAAFAARTRARALVISRRSPVLHQSGDRGLAAHGPYSLVVVP